MLNVRTSGILLHPTSFPSRFGIGDLGDEAYRFIDFLSASFQQIWQVLPLGPTGYGNSPYLCYSAWAGNHLLISLEKLVEEKLLKNEDLNNYPHLSADKIDFDRVIAIKTPLLKQASDNFRDFASVAQQKKFQEFCTRQADWLDDYALFMALKEAHQDTAWNTWDSAIANRKPEAIEHWRDRLKSSIFYHQFVQFQFFSQWQKLKAYANKKGVQIFGDIPIYVAHDSVDVWANPEIFCLDRKTGEAALMAGVPPDYFSATGQLWGNPVYQWEELEKTNFSWWIRRVQGILDLVDIIRIDHFRGFQAFWAVPEGEETAINGEWIEAPGEAFFQILRDKLGELPIIAEDLGVITEEVEQLRDNFNFPGMKILQFAFDSDRANPFLPFNYVNRNCVVYTGTHDNDTTVGWYNQRSSEEQLRIIDYLGCVCSEGIHWSLIRLALGSVANQAVFPLQDILGLGSEAKMNTPSTVEGNWAWYYHPEALTTQLSDRLKYLTYLYGRAPQPQVKNGSSSILG